MKKIQGEREREKHYKARGVYRLSVTIIKLPKYWAKTRSPSWYFASKTQNLQNAAALQFKSKSWFPRKPTYTWKFKPTCSSLFLSAMRNSIFFLTLLTLTVAYSLQFQAHAAPAGKLLLTNFSNSLSWFGFCVWSVGLLGMLCFLTCFSYECIALLYR